MVTAFLLILLHDLSTQHTICVGADALSAHSALTHIHSMCAVRYLTNVQLDRYVIVRCRSTRYSLVVGVLGAVVQQALVSVRATCVAASFVFFRT
jgi:hypothetical protein